MTYVLARLFIAAIGWGFTCAVMWATLPDVSVIGACYAAAAWALVAVLYIWYMRKLRHEFQELRVAKAELQLASLRLMGQRMRRAEAAPQLAASTHPLDRAA